jgi:hypothetical protein
MRSLVTNVLRFKTPLERLNSLAAVDGQPRSCGADGRPLQREAADRHNYHLEISINRRDPLPSAPDHAKPVRSRENKST